MKHLRISTWSFFAVFLSLWSIFNNVDAIGTTDRINESDQEASPLNRAIEVIQQLRHLEGKSPKIAEMRLKLEKSIDSALNNRCATCFSVRQKIFPKFL